MSSRADSNGSIELEGSRGRSELLRMGTVAGVAAAVTRVAMPMEALAEPAAQPTVTHRVYLDIGERALWIYTRCTSRPSPSAALPVNSDP